MPQNRSSIRSPIGRPNVSTMKATPISVRSTGIRSRPSTKRPCTKKFSNQSWPGMSHLLIHARAFRLRQHDIQDKEKDPVPQGTGLARGTTLLAANGDLSVEHARQGDLCSRPANEGRPRPRLLLAMSEVQEAAREGYSAGRLRGRFHLSASLIRPTTGVLVSVNAVSVVVPRVYACSAGVNCLPHARGRQHLIQQDHEVPGLARIAEHQPPLARVEDEARVLEQGRHFEGAAGGCGRCQGSGVLPGDDPVGAAVEEEEGGTEAVDPVQRRELL